METAANIPLGIVKWAGNPDYGIPRLDIAWVATVSGQDPVPKINGYSDGIINVPAKWSGVLESPVGGIVCRYGQTSGGPHCGTVASKGKMYNFYPIGYIDGVTAVSGSCSDDGDSGGPWLSASSYQVQGTNIGATETNTCPDHVDDETYFQPIHYHIDKYSDYWYAPAGSLLTTHGAAAPTLSGFKCPDMDNSGSNT